MATVFNSPILFATGRLAYPQAMIDRLLLIPAHDMEQCGHYWVEEETECFVFLHVLYIGSFVAIRNLCAHFTRSS